MDDLIRLRAFFQFDDYFMNSKTVSEVFHVNSHYYSPSNNYLLQFACLEFFLCFAERLFTWWALLLHGFEKRLFLECDLFDVKTKT